MRACRDAIGRINPFDFKESSAAGNLFFDVILTSFTLSSPAVTTSMWSAILADLPTRVLLNAVMDITVAKTVNDAMILCILIYRCKVSHFSSNKRHPAALNLFKTHF